MSSIIINANNITNTTTNSTFQVDFDRTKNLTDKHISLTSASMYFSWRNITTLNNKFSYIWIDHFWNPYRVWVFKDRCRKFFFGTELQNGGSSAAALKPKNVAVLLSIWTKTSWALSYGICKCIAYPPTRFVVYGTHAKCHEGHARNQGIFTFLELPSDRNATISPL